MDKSDIARDRESIEKASGTAVHVMSGVSGDGVQDLLYELARIVVKARGAKSHAGAQAESWSP